MSGYIAGAVWTSGPKERAERYVLLAIADNCNETGFCFPSIEHLAEKCLLSERHVLRAVKKLEDDGWLEVNKHDIKHKGNSYQIVLDKLSFVRPKSRDKRSHDIQSTSHMTSATEMGDIRDIAIMKNLQEPPIETSLSETSSDGFALTSLESKKEKKKEKKRKPPKADDSELKERIRGFIQRTILAKTKIKCMWDASEAKVLDQVIKSNPSWTVADWERMLRNWRDSDPQRVQFGERPRLLLSRISRFTSGPFTRFGVSLETSEETAGEEEFAGATPVNEIARKQKGIV